MELFLGECDCETPLGDAAETARRLAAGERALQQQPVLGEAGGEPVPLATFEPMDSACPPRWWPRVEAFARRLPERPWGDARHPVIVTSSNYGIDQLYHFWQDERPERRPFLQPQDCVDWMASELGWGRNHWLVSNACVSAQLGMVQARRLLEAGRAEAVLVFTFDFVSPFVAGGFHALKILNGDWPAPYAARDTGAIGLDDGLGFAVLSREPSRYRLLAEATHFESAHMTSNRADGAGFRELIAGLGTLPADCRPWVKGHGTGTLDAGRLEAEAFAERFPGAPLVGWKGSLGHTLGSCGLIEAAIARAAIEQGQVPGTVASAPPFFSPNVASQPFDPADFNAVLLVSNAFGGAHAAHLIAYD